MFKLLKFMSKKDVGLTILSFFLIMIQTACDIAQPFLLALLIPNEQVDLSTFELDYELVGLMLGLIIFGLIAQGIGIVTSARVGVRLGSNIRYQAFKKIQSLTFKEIDSLTTPSLITRLTNDVMFYQNTVIIAIRIVIRSILLIIGGVIATFVLGTQIGLWWIGFIFLLFMLIVSLAIFLILKKSIPYFRRQQKLLDHLNGVMRENLLGVRVVKVFNLQNEQIEKFDYQNEKFMKVSTIANRWATSIIPVIFFIVQISVVVIIMIIPSILGSERSTNITIVLQVIQLTSLVVLGIILIVTVLINLAYVKTSCDRINEIFDSNPSIPRNTSNNMVENSNIEFKNVSYKYHSTDESENALTDISFNIKAGEMVGIIGPTGSGKTTLVNLITRMYDVTNGEIYISNHNIKDINYNSLRDSIGVSPQKSVLFSGTIGSNIKFGRDEATIEEMEYAAQMAQAIEFINSKDGRFDAIVEQRGTNLSGGQKQRISIARALIKNPKILILDDSTSALDMITESKVQDAIRNHKETTIFLIGQRVNAISKADKIIVLDKGKMVGFGTHKSLMKTCDLYKEISLSQGFGG